MLAPNYYEGGGGICIGGGDVALIGNTINVNTSGERAGGVYVQGGSVTLTGNTFVGNRGIGREGGGLHVRYATASLAENTFRDNHAYWGGGVYADSGTLTLTHNLFISNSVVVYSGGAVTLLYGQARLDYNTILSNTANDRGGGVHLYHADVALQGNLFRHNRSLHDGGGLSALGGTISLVNNVFADNQAANNGGGLMLLGATTRLRHTTLARNNSSAAWIEGGTAWLTNTLVYSHTLGVDNVSGAVTMTQTLWDGVLTHTLGAVAESGSFTGTAAFAADGYHLSEPSDAVDAGVFAGVGSDLDGERRPMGGGPDVGADEYPSTLGIYLPLVWKAPTGGPGQPTPPAR